MTLQTIKQALNQTKNEIGLVGGSLKIQEYDDAQHNLVAYITPEGWDIEMKLKRGFSPVQDRRQKAYARKKKIIDGLETLLTDVLHHECGHWELPLGSERGCPYDIYNHDKVLEAVKNALPKDKKGQAAYVTSAFEDVLVNARCEEFKGDFSGQVLFWDNEGLALRSQGKEHYTPFYEAFVKLNMYLIGDNSDVALLKRHYTNDAKVDSAIEKVIRDLRLPKDIARNQGTSVLFNKKQWPAMASTFTKHLAPLLDEAPSERLSAFGNGSQGEGEDKEEQSPAGNGIDQKMKTPDGKEEIAYGRYSGGENLSTNISSYEQLDAIYRHLAKDIPVRVEAMTRTQSLPIAPLTYRTYDEEKDDPLRVKASKLRIVEEEMTFAYPHQPLVVEARFKMQRKSFPNFKMVVLDSSGSMAQSPQDDDKVGNKNSIPWGDNSKYHYALLGFYGIEGFLQRQGIAPYITHGVSLFSTHTRYKEADFEGLDTVRKLALAPDFGGDTKLDAKVLTTALKGRESFVLSLSDGEIGNWDSEKSTFQTLASQNYYAHIHLGGKTQFTKDLESWKLPVFYVKSGKDIAHLMVDITKKQYERFTRL